ncbi:MAG: hypothetical protein IPQ02_17455 [Saprospiraceae bacterium]|nr:hypothetical protein [Candidatus Defluviibacterium haderslevense]
MLPPVIVTTGFGSTVNVRLAVPVHPFASVTVTLYVPAALTLILCVVAVVDHKYVNGAVPTLAFAVNVLLVPAHILVSPVIVTTGFGSTVNVRLAVPVHPFASVTVTLYVPAVLTLILCVVAVVDHKYVNGAVPTLGLAVNVLLVPAHILLPPVIVTTGFGSTVNVRLAVPVHPFASVTVTLYVLLTLILLCCRSR